MSEVEINAEPAPVAPACRGRRETQRRGAIRAGRPEPRVACGGTGSEEYEAGTVEKRPSDVVWRLTSRHIASSSLRLVQTWDTASSVGPRARGGNRYLHFRVRPYLLLRARAHAVPL